MLTKDNIRLHHLSSKLQCNAFATEEVARLLFSDLLHCKQTVGYTRLMSGHKSLWLSLLQGAKEGPI